MSIYVYTCVYLADCNLDRGVPPSRPTAAQNYFILFFSIGIRIPLKRMKNKHESNESPPSPPEKSLRKKTHQNITFLYPYWRSRSISAHFGQAIGPPEIRSGGSAEDLQGIAALPVTLGLRRAGGRDPSLSADAEAHEGRVLRKANLKLK